MENRTVRTGDSRKLKACSFCGKPVFDDKALVSDRKMFCDKVCKANYRFIRKKADAKFKG